MSDTKDEFVQRADQYYDDAKQCFKEVKISETAVLLHNAVNLYKKAEMYEKEANSLNMLGIVYAALGDAGMSMDCYIEALDIAQEYGYNDIMMLLYNNIGSKYQDIGKHAKAIEYFKKAVNKFKQPSIRGKDSYYKWLLFLNLNLCISYTGLDEFEKAEEYLQEAWAYSEIEKDVDSSFFVDIAQARLFWRMGRENEVREHVDELVEGALAHISASDYVLEIKNLCELFMEMGEFDAWAMVVSSFERNVSTMGNLYYRISCIEMWMKYYRAIGEVDKYNEKCIEYVNLHTEQENQQIERMCEMIDMKLELQQREYQHKKIMNSVNIDILTGFGNRNVMKSDFEKMFVESMRKCGLTMGIVDIDFFKAFNKTSEKITGEDVLGIVADIIRKEIDGIGTGYHFNGDEFYIMINDIDKDKINMIAENISQEVNELKIFNPGSKVDKYLTVSQAYVIAERLMVPDEYTRLCNTVDAALDCVKDNGKNSFVISYL